MAEENKSAQGRKTNLIIAAVCLVVIIVAAAVLIFRDNGSSDKTSSKPNDNTGNAVMSLSPSSQTIEKNADFSVTIWANSGGLSVNAVQANLAYPTDMFDFVGIDTASSAFSMDAQSLGNDGKVAIARGSTTPLRGNLQVAVVKLHSKDKAGQAKLNFFKGTVLLSDTKHQDILTSRTPATFTVK